jgi:hypothetical protein
LVFTPAPVIDMYMDGRVDAGAEEIRRKSTVTCRGAAGRQPLAGFEVERILLARQAGRGWSLSVSLSGRCVLVSGFWAQPREEWDCMVELPRDLRKAVR